MTARETVTIRAASREDAKSILGIYAPLVIESIVTFEESPPSLDEMTSRVEASHEWLVAEENGDVVGYASATRFHPRAAYRWSVEVSIYLGPSARGRGIGPQLLRALLARLTERGFVNVFAGIALPNPASVGLFESLGFAKIAHQKAVGFKLGAWHDVGWWQFQLRAADVPPPELAP